MASDSIFELNGGTVIAMCGKDCVTIGSDLRLGNRMLTITTNKEKVYKMGDRLYLGLGGLATDCQTVAERLTFRKNLYELRENRPMKPKTFSHMMAAFLYEHRFGPYFINPVVAGLDPITNTPQIFATDSIGCLSSHPDFVVVGTAEAEATGACEAFWEPNMDKDTLFEATAQSLLAGLDRNALSGWGVVIYTITPTGVEAKTIKARLD